MDNSSLMNRENKKRQLRRQIVPPRYQTEEESEQAIRNAHKKTVRKRLAVLAVVAVLLGALSFLLRLSGRVGEEPGRGKSGSSSKRRGKFLRVCRLW